MPQKKLCDLSGHGNFSIMMLAILIILPDAYKLRHLADKTKMTQTDADHSNINP